MTGLRERHHASEAVASAVGELIAADAGKPPDRPKVLMVLPRRDRHVKKRVVASDPTEQDRARDRLRRQHKVSDGHRAREPRKQIDGRAQLTVAVARKGSFDALDQFVARQATYISSRTPSENGGRSRDEGRRVLPTAPCPNHPYNRTVGLPRRDLLLRRAAVAKGEVLGILVKRDHVDALSVLGEQIASARRNPRVTATSALKRSRLRKVRECPADPVIEQPRPAARNHLLTLGLADLELTGDDVTKLGGASLVSVLMRRENRTHQRLKIGDRHRPRLYLARGNSLTQAGSAGGAATRTQAHDMACASTAALA
ncbi:MAG: hypothetical protein M3417_16060 [Actinomycetota bacterium]|nr:hypothetical protein [Actinomycetota bacterium]